MNIKRYCRQPKVIAKARRKYPFVSTCLIAVAFAGLLLSGDSMAAKDGDKGATSDAQMNISLTVLNSVRIHQMQDIKAVLNQDDGIAQANDKLRGVNACVYSTSGAYTLQAKNNNGSQNGYAMLRGNQHQLPYHLNIADNNGNRYNSVLQANNRVQMKSSSDANCSSGKNLHIQMQLPSSAELTPDHYSDVVNFTVAPV